MVVTVCKGHSHCGEHLCHWRNDQTLENDLTTTPLFNRYCFLGKSKGFFKSQILSKITLRIWSTVTTGGSPALPCPSPCLILAIVRGFLRSIHQMRSQQLNPCQRWKSDSRCYCVSLTLLPCGRFSNTHTHKVGDYFHQTYPLQGAICLHYSGVSHRDKGTVLHYSLQKLQNGIKATVIMHDMLENKWLWCV